jgi:DNA-binding HxlR family transcriptional regulator
MKTNAPRPGTRVRGSRTGRPIMALLDLLGRRWCLRVLWELRHHPATFRALRDRCDAVSPTVLARRLVELREVGVVSTNPRAGYALTAHGRTLVGALEPLHAWATAWGRRSGAASAGASRASSSR